jgi:hypothetical protein
MANLCAKDTLMSKDFLLRNQKKKKGFAILVIIDHPLMID